MTHLSLLAVLLLAADRPLVDPRSIPPRDPHPFGAIETRPLWERPRRDPLTLQQRAEDALDRGTGRIEDEQTFQLRQLERDRLRRDFDLAPRAADAADDADYAMFRAERERQERIEQRQWQLELAERRRQRLERESDALADVRERFAEEARRDPALGAVVDRQGLQAVEREYRAAVDAAVKRHADAVAVLAADPKLSAEARAAGRAAADRELEQTRNAAARRWEQRRKEVLGQK